MNVEEKFLRDFKNWRPISIGNSSEGQFSKSKFSRTQPFGHAYSNPPHL